MSNLSSNYPMIRARRAFARARVRGVSLIELMVAMVISLVLIGGAIQVYLFSRENYQANEEFAQLQDTARFALSVIEPDIRMANSWGLVKGAGFVEMRGLDSSCGLALAVDDEDPAKDVLASLDGGNNQYSVGCEALGNGAVASADTLVVQRASVTPATVTNGRLLVCSTRTFARLVNDSTDVTLCPADPIGQVSDLVANAYYVNRDAEQRAGVPTLRRWGLGAGNVMAEVEIVPGVEDMQIQFGIDPSGTSGIATGYVNPGEIPEGAQVVSVRLWLLVRAETRDLSFTDDTMYEYGDRKEGNGITSDLNAAGAGTQAYQPGDNFRRLLVARTIQLRNAMGT